MRAVVLKDDGLKLEERPDTVPGSDQLLVKAEASGINGADISQRAGNYSAPPGAPVDIPGSRARRHGRRHRAPVGRFVVGQRVMSIVADGAQAELCVIQERVAIPVPSGLSSLEAGCFVEVFMTAHDALFTQWELKMGERLLVTGAAGGARRCRT